METVEAVDKLISELREDSLYYCSWQNGISMAFYDEMRRRGYQIPDMLEVANEAAKNFLDMLIRGK